MAAPQTQARHRAFPFRAQQSRRQAPAAHSADAATRRAVSGLRTRSDSLRARRAGAAGTLARATDSASRRVPALLVLPGLPAARALRRARAGAHRAAAAGGAAWHGVRLEPD